MNEANRIEDVPGDNENAFREIIQKHQKRLYNIIYRVVYNEHDAEDILQETFLIAYGKLKDFRKESSMFTWLVSIAYNVARQYLRRRGLLRWLSLEQEAFSVEDTVSQKLEGEELKAAIRHALLQLPVKHRFALVLSEVEGLEQNVIAGIMDCEVGTVWSYISRAKERLKILLKGHYE